MIIYRYGGFLRRLSAFLIDSLFLQAAAFLVTVIGILIIGSDSELPGGEIGPLLNSYYASAAVMCIFYFIYFHAVTGQTIGKRMLGMKVVQTTGEPMSAGAAFLRCVGYLVSGMFFFLGFLWIAFDGRKQGWHDKIAGTLVIRGEPHLTEQPGLF